MSDTEKQSSFGKGEISPDLQGRDDTSLYDIALNQQRNWNTLRTGGVQTRPGTQYIGRVKTSSAGKVKLIPFTFSQSVTFMLEFGNLYVRFIKNGSQITQTAVTITGINQNAACTVTAANAYVAGDEVILSGIVGMTQLNGRNVLVASPTGANFKITDLDGTPIDTTSFTAYTSGGQAARVYQLTTPYVTADLQTLNFVQSANVLTIAHNNYPPADISRVSDNSWTYTVITFKPGLDGPSNIAFTSPPAAAVSITSISQASPMVVTKNGHGLVDGDKIKFTVLGMLELNDITYGTVTSSAANTFQAYYFGTTTKIDSSGYAAFVSGTFTKLNGTTPAGSTIAYEVTAISSTTSEESLPGLGAAQTITAYQTTVAGNIVNLTRVAHGLSSGNTVSLNATSVSHILTRMQAAGAGVDVTWTSVGHGFANTNTLYLSGISGAFTAFLTADPNNQNWTIANVTADTFTLTGVQSNSAFDLSSLHIGDVVQPYLATYGNQTWVITRVDADNFTLNGATVTTAGTVTANTNATINANATSTSNAPTVGTPNVLTWSSVAGASQYNVYSSTNGVYGYIGTTATLTFTDIGITANNAVNPPIPSNPFPTPGNYPAVVGYYQSRLCFANTTNNVATFWASKPGCRTNYTTHIPLQTGDGAQFTITGNNEVNPIMGMMDCRYLILFTAGGEWAVFGNQSGILDPTSSFGVVQSSVFGANAVRPLLVNTEVLYLQAQGSMIRSLEYQFTQSNFTGKELSLESNHLFDTYTITDWAYQKIPHSIVAAVRNDGTLLMFTYVKEQQMQAWSHHDFIGQVTPTGGTLPLVTSFGTVENVACVPEGNETALYMVVNRSLYGSNIRYIERMSSRLISNIADISTYNGMDAALTFNGTGSTSVSMQFSGGVNYDYTEHITLTASSATFTSANVGDAYFVYTVPTVPLQPLQQVRFVVDAFVSTTQVKGHVQGAPVPSTLTAGSSTNWARAVNRVTGLWHLKNQAVSVFGDGYVIGNPFNRLYATLYIVDANGNLLLDTDKWYSKITVGLPVTCDIQTLDISSPSKEYGSYQNMIVSEIEMMIRESRGIWAGQAAPVADAYGSVDTSQTGLERVPPRNTDTDGYNQPPQLQETDRISQPIQGGWDTKGRAFVRVTDPVPVTILQLSAHGSLPPRNPQKQ